MTRKMMNQLTTTQQIVLLIMMSFVISISGQNNNTTKQVNARIKLVLTWLITLYPIPILSHGFIIVQTTKWEGVE